MKIVALVALVMTCATLPSLALGESRENPLGESRESPLGESRESGECDYRASFNCALADDAESRAICSSSELRSADCAMGYAYRDARALPGANPNERLRKNQRRWVAARDAACAGRSGPALTKCLRDETERRIRWLIEQHHLPVAGKVYEQYRGATPLKSE